MPRAGRLRHCLTTHYVRFTLVLPGKAGRVTVDRDLVFALPTGPGVAVTALAIIETKCPGRPTAVDRALWSVGYRPLALSKFAVGLSLLRPDLPANRWYRTRKRLEHASKSIEIDENALDDGLDNLGTGRLKIGECLI